LAATFSIDSQCWYLRGNCDVEYLCKDAVVLSISKKLIIF